MTFKLPPRLIWYVLRFGLRPFLGPPFGFWVMRFWCRVASILNPSDGRATVDSLEAGGMSALRARPQGEEPQLTVLFLHGGGYCFGSYATHRALVTPLAVQSQATVYVPNYRLAPEDPHPAALEDALRAYQWLLDQGVPPDRIALAGDSAGGGLALATALALRDRGAPLPSSLTLISPWVDLRCDAPSIRERASRDPMLRPDGTFKCAAAYLGGRDASDLACSPLFADHAGLPPTLIHVGSEEILFDDSVRLAERLRVAGVDVTFKVFEGLWHDLHIHAGLMQESMDAVVELGEFIRKHGEVGSRAQVLRAG